MIVYFQENSLICKCSPIWRRHCDASLCSAPKTSCLPKLPISDVASFFGGKSWNVGKVGKVGKASAAEPSPLIRKSPGCIQCFLLPFFPLCSSQSVGLFFSFRWGSESPPLFNARAASCWKRTRLLHRWMPIHIFTYIHIPFRSYTYVSAKNNRNEWQTTTENL